MTLPHEGGMSRVQTIVDESPYPPQGNLNAVAA